MALDYYNLGRKLKKSIRYLAELNKQNNKLIIMQITYNAKYIKLHINLREGGKLPPQPCDWRLPCDWKTSGVLLAMRRIGETPPAEVEISEHRGQGIMGERLV